MTEKMVNYTAEQTKQMVEDYKAGVTTEAIAKKLGKSVRSVVAKLSRENVYIAKSATKSVRVTKSMLIAGIAVTLSLKAAELESLEKASHEALELVFRGVAMLDEKAKDFATEAEIAE